MYLPGSLNIYLNDMHHITLLTFKCFIIGSHTFLDGLWKQLILINACVLDLEIIVYTVY